MKLAPIKEVSKRYPSFVSTQDASMASSLSDIWQATPISQSRRNPNNKGKQKTKRLTNNFQPIILSPLPNPTSLSPITPMPPFLRHRQFQPLRGPILRNHHHNHISMPSCPLWRRRCLVLHQLLHASRFRGDQPMAHLTPSWVVTGRSIRVREGEDELSVIREIGRGDLVDYDGRGLLQGGRRKCVA